MRTALLLSVALLGCPSADGGNTGGGSGGSGGSAGSGTGGGMSGTGGGTAGSGTGGGSATGGGAALPPMAMPFASETDAQDIALDSTGGVHVAAHVTGTLTNNIVYSYCASNCGVKANHQTVVLGSIGLSNSELALEVTAQGKPRLLQPGIDTGPDGFDYFACDSNCTQAGSWTRTRVKDDSARATVAFEHEYFAVGPSGQASFVYVSSQGTNIVTCASNCTSAASWSSGVLSLDAFSDIQLRYDAQGTLHLAAVDLSNPGQYHPLYLACSSACATGTNWTGVLFNNTANPPVISMALSADRPRIAAWFDTVGNTSIDQKMMLLACDTSCTMPANWRSVVLDWPEKSSARIERRTKLLMNAQDGAILLSRGWLSIYAGLCQSGCSQTTGQWSVGAINTSDLMTAAFPILQPCQAATWFFDYGMSGGLTPTGGLVLGFGAHGRALSGNDAGVCSDGFNYNYRTVVQVVQ